MIWHINEGIIIPNNSSTKKKHGVIKYQVVMNEILLCPSFYSGESHYSYSIIVYKTYNPHQNALKHPLPPAQCCFNADHRTMTGALLLTGWVRQMTLEGLCPSSVQTKLRTSQERLWWSPVAYLPSYSSGEPKFWHRMLVVETMCTV